MNLADNLLKNYNEKPNKICLIQNDRKITYKELYMEVSKFKKYLEEKGVTKNSKILILVPMSIDLYITLLSLWSIGATCCFMDAGFIKSGIIKNEFLEIDGIIGISKYLLYANINKNLNGLSIKINTNVIKNLTLKKELKVEKLESETPAILTYTSGTTGIPKIAARTHEFLQNQGKAATKCMGYSLPTDPSSSSVFPALCKGLIRSIHHHPISA